ncbi:DUF6169 family protein [Runella zeae]|uniref:DUF6169 family protein n=1 Tax=Runella zeae TaxID=94255 RepID=UPI000490C987|nr:DUF6169 family protein [Runella zeae]
MVSSLSSLNPYPSYRKNNDIVFCTEEGTEYEIYFAEGEGYFEQEPFAEFVKIFGFRVLTNPFSRIYNPRIAETVVYHLLEFFEDNRAIVLYTCDQSDGREAKRKKLFEKWYKIYATSEFVRWDFSFEGTLFLSILLKSDNPYLDAIKEALPKAGEPYK